MFHGDKVLISLMHVSRTEVCVGTHPRRARARVRESVFCEIILLIFRPKISSIMTLTTIKGREWPACESSAVSQSTGQTRLRELCTATTSAIPQSRKSRGLLPWEDGYRKIETIYWGKREKIGIFVASLKKRRHAYGWASRGVDDVANSVKFRMVLGRRTRPSDP